MDQLNDQMNSFPQDMLELSATKQNIKQFILKALAKVPSLAMHNMYLCTFESSRAFHC